MSGLSRPVVIVRVARIDDARQDVDALLGELDERERRRAEQFHTPIDRARFVLGHAMLARAASDDDPGRLPLARHLSLSHAGRLVAVAIAPRGIAVGIDVEPIDATRSDRAVADRFLAPRDVADIDSAAPDERPRRFARAWTSLEAEAKGRRVSLDALRGRPRTGCCVEIAVDPDHIVSLWTALPTAAIRVDRRLLASAA